MNEMDNHSDYPKMLYIEDKEQEGIEGRWYVNPVVAYKTVANAGEEKLAKKSGWKTTTQEVVKIIERKRKVAKCPRYLLKHFKFIIGTSIALAGLYLGYLSYLKQ